MKKFWAIPLAILISLLMTSFTYADESDDSSELKTVFVSTETEFVSAASDTSAFILFNGGTKEITISKNTQLLATVNLLKNQKLIIERGVTLTLSGKSLIILAGGTLEVSPDAKIVTTSNNTTINVSIGGVLENSGSIEGNTTMTVYEGGKVRNSSSGKIEWSISVYGEDQSCIENNGTMGQNASFAQDVYVALDLYGASEKEKINFIHQLFNATSLWNFEDGDPYVLEQLQDSSNFFYPDVPSLSGYKFVGWMIAIPQDNKSLKETSKVCLEEFNGDLRNIPESGIYGYYVKENESTNISGTCTEKHIIDKDTLVNTYKDMSKYYGYETETTKDDENKGTDEENNPSIVISKKNLIIIGCIACVILVALVGSLIITIRYVKGRNKVKSVNIYKKNK